MHQQRVGRFAFWLTLIIPPAIIVLFGGQLLIDHHLNPGTSPVSTQQLAYPVLIVLGVVTAISTFVALMIRLIVRYNLNHPVYLVTTARVLTLNNKGRRPRLRSQHPAAAFSQLVVTLKPGGHGDLDFTPGPVITDTETSWSNIRLVPDIEKVAALIHEQFQPENFHATLDLDTAPRQLLENLPEPYRPEQTMTKKNEPLPGPYLVRTLLETMHNSVQPGETVLWSATTHTEWRSEAASKAYILLFWIWFMVTLSAAYLYSIPPFGAGATNNAWITDSVFLACSAASLYALIRWREPIKKSLSSNSHNPVAYLLTTRGLTIARLFKDSTSVKALTKNGHTIERPADMLRNWLDYLKVRTIPWHRLHAAERSIDESGRGSLVFPMADPARVKETGELIKIEGVSNALALDLAIRAIAAHVDPLTPPTATPDPIRSSPC